MKCTSILAAVVLLSASACSDNDGEAHNPTDAGYEFREGWESSKPLADLDEADTAFVCDYLTQALDNLVPPKDLQHADCVLKHGGADVAACERDANECAEHSPEPRRCSDASVRACSVAVKDAHVCLLGQWQSLSAFIADASCAAMSDTFYAAVLAKKRQEPGLGCETLQADCPDLFGALK